MKLFASINFTAVFLLFFLAHSAELGCYEPICDQGTAYFSSIFGHAGIDIFIDREGDGDIVNICAQVSPSGSNMDSLLGFDEHCAFSTDSGHIHFPMRTDSSLRSLNIEYIRNSFVDVQSVYLHRNNTTTAGKKRTYLVLCITDYHETTPATALGTVYMRKPRFGSIHANDFDAEYLASEPVKYNSEGLHLIVDDVHEGILNPLMTSLHGKREDTIDAHFGDVPEQDQMQGGIEPATWFFSVIPLLTPDAKKMGIVGFPTIGYVEYVLTPQQLLKQRNFAALQHFDGLIEGDDTIFSKASKRINVCIWASGQPDGQKRIYLEQMQSLSSEFKFTYFLSSESPLILTDAERPLNDFEQKLFGLMQRNDSTRPEVDVVRSPMLGFRVNRSSLSESPADGSKPIDANSSSDDILRYMALRFREAGGNVDAITPTWVQEPYVIVRDALRDYHCDVSVHGNGRGLTPDFLITSSARSLNIPSVSELLNLYVDGDCVPDVIVSPSKYAVEHNSVSWLRRKRMLNGTCAYAQSSISVDSAPRGLDLQRHTCGPLTTIISPAVDINLFNPDRVRKDQFAYALFSNDANCLSSGCQIIGFMARLSSEKNPGLFLLAAHSLLNSHPNSRFVVIGSGHLLDHLKSLTIRLKIESKVVFTGWVPHDKLPSLLANIDIMVNPSVRGWSETFCIANIEAMAMQVPLVTFATGGVGQYIGEPFKNVSMQQSEVFTVGENAVLINEASPQALAMGVAHLLDDIKLQNQIGISGRLTVRKHFNTDLQMWHYAQLYRFLSGINKKP
jgi:glycosyltransferase involved in cell wall biosynthesis